MWTRDGHDAARKASSCCKFSSIPLSSVYFTLTALTLLPCLLSTLMKDWVVVGRISMEGRRVSRRQRLEELWTVACRNLHEAARGRSEEWGRKLRVWRRGRVGRSSRANVVSDCSNSILTLRRKIY